MTYGFGGLNQLRGYEFREFAGSRLAWANLEFRFPLVDRMDFPILRLGQIRGFFFLDVGAAWYTDDSWYDPRVAERSARDVSNETDHFKVWDTENNRFRTCAPPTASASSSSSSAGCSSTGSGRSRWSTRSVPTSTVVLRSTTSRCDGGTTVRVLHRLRLR